MRWSCPCPPATLPSVQMLGEGSRGECCGFLKWLKMAGFSEGQCEGPAQESRQVARVQSRDREDGTGAGWGLRVQA